jgi:hypothetical protein
MLRGSRQCLIVLVWIGAVACSSDREEPAPEVVVPPATTFVPPPRPSAPPPPEPDACGNLPRSPGPSGEAGTVPAAERTWQTPDELGPFVGAWSNQMTFALDREGFGMALWNIEYEPWTSTHSPGGAFSIPLELVLGDIFQPAVAMDGYSGGVAAWIVEGGVKAAAFSSGRFQTPTALTTSMTDELVVATSGKDNALAVWREGTGLNLSERRGDSWSSSEVIQIDGAPALGLELRLALDQSGDGLLLFQGSTLQAARVKYDCSKSLFEGVTELSGTPARNASLRMNTAGKALVAWEEVGASANENLSLQLRMFDPASGWGDAVRVDSPGSVSMSSPVVAMAEDGSASVIWTQRGELYEVWARRYTLEAGWGEGERLEARGGDRPQIAVGGDGTLVALWQGGYGSTFELRAAVALPGGNWGTPVAVSGVLDCSTSTCAPTIDFSANLAMDRYGRASVIWISPANEVAFTNAFR